MSIYGYRNTAINAKKYADINIKDVVLNDCLIAFDSILMFIVVFIICWTISSSSTPQPYRLKHMSPILSNPLTTFSLFPKTKTHKNKQLFYYLTNSIKTLVLLMAPPRVSSWTLWFFASTQTETLRLTTTVRFLVTWPRINYSRS